MTDQHEQFSDQMLSYARGELAGAEAAALETHLVDCEECRAELKGVQALAEMGSGDLDAPMSEMERARVHREVLGATTGEQTSSAHAPARRSIASRIAPALGAAALFALFAFGATQLFTGMGGDDESAGDAGAGMAAESNEAELEDGGPLGLPPAAAARSGPVASNDSALQGDVDGGTGEGTGGEGPGEEVASGSAFGAADPQPYFEPGPRTFTDSAFRRLGETRDPFDSFAAMYRAGDGTDRDALTTQLAMTSPEPGEVRTCANGVLDLDPHALPAYGALGTYEGGYVLALGFVTAPQGPLRNFEIWVWNVGDCTSPVTRIGGRI